MPRLLHVLSQRPGRSGSGVFLKSMVREAARRGYEQHAIVAGPADTSHREVPPLARGEVSVVVFPCAEAPFPVPGNSDVMPYPSTVFSEMTEAQVEQYLGAARRVMEDVRRRFRPDLVHAHHLWLMTALARRVFAATSMVATSHNAELRQLVKAPHLAPRVLPGTRGIDRIGVLTPRSYDDTIAAYGVDRGRLAVTGAGFRGDLFKPPEAPRPALLARLAREHGMTLPGDEKLVTFVGRLSSPKGIPFLLAAARHLAESAGGTPAFRVVLVGASGSGEDGRRMDELVREAGDRVLHLGAMPQEAVALVLQCSDLFVLPSLFEGLPLVMLEAAACGCPCLVSGLPTIASWVPAAWRESGTFILVPRLETTRADVPVARDVRRFVADLAGAIGRLLAQPPSASARQALAADLREHTWSAVFGRYERLYGELGVSPP